MIFLIIIGVIIVLAIVLQILENLNITHIFMKGRSSGTISSAMRAVQDALEPNAQKAHEYIIEEKEKKDKFQIPSSEDDGERE
ncbi:hypothetical protein KAX97_01585 [candidate division WOR-3 bacterium]|nr:hypothetical protein [candidate division WOR-3 bacterium]